MYSFATQPVKLKLGQQISGALLIGNHLDEYYDEPIRNIEQQLYHI
jgi:hypothetical protein